MAPSTRSQSANNTPVKSLDPIVAKNDSPASSSPHTRRCTKCNRPRFGHPRSGCPFVSSDAGENSTHFTTALGSMTISTRGGDDDDDNEDDIPPETPVRRKGRRSLGPVSPSLPADFKPEDTKQVIRARRKSERDAAALTLNQSLPSLTESEMAALLFPYDNDVSEDGRGGGGREDVEANKGVHWKERIELLSVGGTISTREFEKGRAKMPGTLVTPWSSFNASLTGDDRKMDLFGADGLSRPSYSSSSTSSTSTATSGGRDNTISVEVVSPSSSTGSRPLARSMSMEERAGFIEHLEAISTAKAYVITDADAVQLQGWTPRGLHSKILKVGDGSQGENVLVVGRDKEKTESLFRELNAGKQKAQGVGMKTAMGGAVIGAVATWTGLAFS
ncbi:hypothetical protein D9757_001140 [Collybiopsis confluens]|uniref:Uncharacterized protein n=1 Tax=Collybiopsis confluens TaxID=2823264 RepID=A0A8H5I0T1_9AGAR|nr:hypothetical protein D9757_001140 [Collybiopsis confluens]